MDLFDFDVIRTQVHSALRNWHRPESQDNLLNRLQLIQYERRRLAESNGPGAQRLATNRVLLHTIDNLRINDTESADIITMRFLDSETVQAAALQLNVSVDTLNRRQRESIEALTKTIISAEKELRQERIRELEAKLETTPTKLFGVASAFESLQTTLQTPNTPSLVAIAGIGGIGKTALADAVARSLIYQLVFEDVIWVRFEPSMVAGKHTPEIAWNHIFEAIVGQIDSIPASSSPQQRKELVYRQLKAHPTLIVIDNIEEDSDVAYLIEHLAWFADPSRFLITSRSRPLFSQAIYTQDLSELPEADAFQLIRHEASVRQMDDLVAADDEQLIPIYNATGGNPLALKLVIAMYGVMDMSDALVAINNAAQQSTEEMYTNIYHRAWQTLSDPARELLESMPLMAKGGADTEQMKAVSQLSERDFWLAAQELIARSLLEVRSEKMQKQYGIHRLTETFLHSEITGWWDRDAADSKDSKL